MSLTCPCPPGDFTQTDDPVLAANTSLVYWVFGVGSLLLSLVFTTAFGLYQDSWAKKKGTGMPTMERMFYGVCCSSVVFFFCDFVHRTGRERKGTVDPAGP